MILAIDFDGVLHDFKHPANGGRMGAPIEGARAAMIELHNGGHTLIVFTAWPEERQDAIINWLHYYAIPFDYITNEKPVADFYIDDKALRFVNWADVLDTLLRAET